MRDSSDSRQQFDSTAEYRLRICRAIDFINGHLAEVPSVGEVARAASFSSFHFQRLFRAIMGETVADFTRRLRLETAARHLRHRVDGDITSLAFELGFSSSQNFAKAFKSHFGVSPSAYRTQAHKDNQVNSLGTDNRPRSDSTLSIPAMSGSVAEPLIVEVRNLPECRVVYQRHFGAYNDAGVQVAFDELIRWAKPRGLDQLDRYLGIPWDDSDVTHDQRCRFDACLVIPGDYEIGRGITDQRIPNGCYAVHRCKVIGNDFDLPWTRLMRDWLPSSCFLPADGPRIERYLTDGSQDPDGQWQMEICLPVKPL